MAIKNAKMLSEAFEVQYEETKKRLFETIRGVARTTAAWNEPNGLYVAWQMVYTYMHFRSVGMLSTYVRMFV